MYIPVTRGAGLFDSPFIILRELKMGIGRNLYKGRLCPSFGDRVGEGSLPGGGVRGDRGGGGELYEVKRGRKF